MQMLLEHEGEYESRWAAMESISKTIGCTAETLRSWVKQEEIDTGRRDGLTSDGWTQWIDATPNL